MTSPSLIPVSLSRRSLLLGALGSSLALTGCLPPPVAQEPPPFVPDRFAAIYGERPNERFALPETDISEVDPVYLRQEVAFPGAEAPGTVVIDPGNKFLYLVGSNGRALRYGVGVGREGMVWSGRARIARKAEWPRWTPTRDMIARDPEKYAKWAGGMEGGLENPLGARAMYLYDGSRDTMYRIHGTTEPDTIGTNVSSGCIRMFNQDVIDLYSRVPPGTNVLVLPLNRHVEDMAGL